MAALRGVCSPLLFGIVLYLEYLYAQETGGSKCDQSWFISVDSELTVSWRGDERDGTVVADIATKDTYGRKCDSKVSLTAKFNDREIKLGNPCSNALYSVTVSVTCDGITKRQNMTARTPPDAPTILSTIPYNSSINVKWSAPPGPILTYKVILTGGRKEIKTTREETTSTSWIFTSLSPYTIYEVSVMAKNEDHWGKASPVVSVRTLEGLPFEPENLTATDVSSKQIALTWDNPEPDTGPIKRFEIVWIEDGTQQTSRDVSENTAYVIKDLFPYTLYKIEVSAENSIGKGSASVIQVVTKLAVPDPPIMDISDVTNTSISVKWKISDSYRGPDPTYSLQWRREGGSGSFSTAQITKESKEGMYIINTLQPYTTYQIQIRAKNDAGLGPWSLFAEAKTHIGIPSVPMNMKVHYKSSTYVTITWNEPIPANGVILRYEVNWGTKAKSSKTDYVDGTLFNATNLSPYTEYGFLVRAKTELDWGEWSKLFKVRTDVSVPSEPLNLTETEVTDSSIFLEWLVPEHKNGPYLDYVIRWTKTDYDDYDYYYYDDDISNTTSFPSHWRKDEANETSYEITDLDPYTNYSVAVCAKTSAGEGNYTKPLLVQTIAGIPTSPTSVKTVQVQSTSLTVKWSAPKKTNGPVENYVVHWGVQGTDGSKVKTSENAYAALGLRPYTQYFFKIAAETAGGQGPFITIYKRTEISIPTAPTNLLYSDVTDHCILLKWSPPEHPNAPALQYVVKWRGASGESSTQVHETNNTSFRLRELAPETNYSIGVSAQTDAGQGPWTDRIYVRTLQKDHSSAIIAGSVVGILIILIIISSLIVFLLAKKKGGLKNLMPSKTTANNSTESLKTTEVSIALDNLNETEKIKVGQFDEHILRLMSNGYYKLAQEFEKLGKDSPAFPTNEAKKNDNLTKNRWVKILPFDHSRVKLRPVGDEVEPDFINASYVPGDAYLLEYIATQGPLANTVNDFWRMVWQESVFLMVMLTQCVERAKRTCERYWPSAGATNKYGDLEVHSVSESITPNYIQRLFLVTQGGRQRHIVQLHYMNWPVSGCPKSPDDFLSFVRMVRSQISCGVTGPMLVHCSAGIGRTGTFIAVDRLSQQLNRGCEEVDIYGTVQEMRKYRANLVQTEEQYYFIHICVQRIIQEKRQDLENEYGRGIYSD